VAQAVMTSRCCQPTNRPTDRPTPTATSLCFAPARRGGSSSGPRG
jgi:hypothetical protein